ncbi:MAG: hypothetical protein COS14_04155 [Bacteroidetes bacterium CG02_land_8_20_14_3_00_31_25]|nr:MAG: hypothetical protein COX07_06220 [Bacteroidetes bacterium CG23_combo_of_CG06-09_8_20_14_all_32_9]PIV61518.1 MAG: hypothetical protein COS14_04155 [Bacteroidetes bacterium CG02_land_8_20_14_3_00_31_25]PIY03025.1 MAG: hypothetical protein COZ21_11125 [Bacteroidetes bacterium CG_4_10_14_3_um_filter_31_20]
MTFKLSKYNYFYKQDIDTYTCMNLINKTIFGLSTNKIDLINRFYDNPEALKNINPNLFSALFKLGIIINQDINEINFLKTEHRKTIYSTNSYRLTILPTLECNFNCWYCYEDKIKGKMTNEIQIAIYKYVVNLIKTQSLKYFQLDWFGGEPLICFDEVVYPLSKRIALLCKKNGILFNNMITTNGYLISSEMIKKFKKINLKGFQITLDGNEKHHNKVKKGESGHNIYKKTVNNILEIIKRLDDINLMLRINYTENNFESITEIINDIPEVYRNKIEISLQQVWQTEKVNKRMNIIQCNNSFLKEGFVAPLYKLEQKPYRCYADLLSQAVVSYNGNVFKCTARDFANHKPDGILQKNGTIEYNNIYFNRMSKTTIENDNCMSCEFLPACWGPCSQKNIECKPNGFKQICNKSGIEKTIQILMADFYKKNILKQ